MEKLYKNLLIVDGSYMLHKCLRTEELWSLRNSEGIRCGGVYGALNSLNSYIDGTHFPIICWDSGLSTRRQNIYKEYKKDRLNEFLINKTAKEIVEGKKQLQDIQDLDIEKVTTRITKYKNDLSEFGNINDNDYYYQYKMQRDVLISICDRLNVPSVLIDGWEGDDLQTICSRIANHSIIVTDDKDMLQLLDTNVDVNRVMNKEYWTYQAYMQAKGINFKREIVVRKAISGDTSDDIPPATKGLDRANCCGEKTAEIIAKIIVENNENENLYKPILESMSEDSKNKNRNKIKGFLMRLDDYERNLQLVDLSLVENDLSVINYIKDKIDNLKMDFDFNGIDKELGILNITSFDVSEFTTKISSAYNNLRIEGGLF